MKHNNEGYLEEEAALADWIFDLTANVASCNTPHLIYSTLN
jgi:hypothetical protein